MKFRLSPIATAMTLTLASLPAVSAEQVQEVLVEGTAINDPSVNTKSTEALNKGLSADGAELLRKMPGVSAGRMGGHGLELTIRGQNQNRLNVLLDGAYVHGGCPNRMDPPTAYSSAEGYDEITVIKGSQTVQYGGGGSGGTVIFERSKPKFNDGDSTKARLTAGYQGNSDTSELSADIAQKIDKGYVRAIAGWKDGSDYKDGNGAEVRSGYEESTVTLMAGFSPDESTHVVASFEATREDDALFAGAGMDSPKSDMDGFRVKFDKDLSEGSVSSINGEFYLTEVDHVMDNYSLRANTGTWKKTPATSDTMGGRISATYGEVGAETVVGIDYQGNDRDATRYRGAVNTDPSTSESIMWPGAELKQYGLFAESSRGVSDDVAMKLGMRYDRVDASISKGDETWSQSQNHASTGNPQSANALYDAIYTSGAQNNISENNVGGFLRFENEIDGGYVYASVSRSVRTADSTERFLASRMVMMGNDRSWVGNPNLDPEKHHQAEIGLSLDSSQWSTQASVYYSKVDDYILRDKARGQDGVISTVPSTVTIYRNVDATLWGGELAASYKVSPQVSWDAGLSYVNATNDTDTDRAIAQIPPLEAHIGVNYQQADLSLGAEIVANAKQGEVDLTNGSGQDTQKTPGWGILNLDGSYKVASNTSIDFGVNNVFDKVYANHINRENLFDATGVQVNEPGRSVWLRLTARF